MCVFGVALFMWQRWRKKRGVVGERQSRGGRMVAGEEGRKRLEAGGERKGELIRTIFIKQTPYCVYVFDSSTSMFLSSF